MSDYVMGTGVVTKVGNAPSRTLECKNSPVLSHLGRHWKVTNSGNGMEVNYSVFLGYYLTFPYNYVKVVF